jgi:electron transfer flavoprotein alpha subunit
MAKLLVLMETDGGHILEPALAAIKFAQELATAWGAEIDLLAVGGPEIESDLERWRSYGASAIRYAAHPSLAHPTADRVAEVCRRVAEECAAVGLIAASTTFGRDVLPRAAELVGMPMVSDVMAIHAEPSVLQFVRPMYAGNVIATVALSERRGAFSVRTTAFRDPATSQTLSALSAFPADEASLPCGTRWMSLDAPERRRPELTSAPVVVSGGRPLRDAETFERVIGGLADALHGAVGATRAAVDSGIAPNELQVGQTGKVVAPNLYIAAGISGSVQHLAGMKDSRVIVAINTDADAPIFSVADYGLVADLHQAVPELTAAVTAETRK